MKKYFNVQIQILCSVILSVIIITVVNCIAITRISIQLIISLVLVTGLVVKIWWETSLNDELE
jgi:uncharacterized Tic20 family protein